MTDFYAQKIEYEKVLKRSKELGLHWKFDYMTKINSKKLEKFNIEVTTENHVSGQEAKDQEKLDFIKELCPKEGKFFWTDKHNLRKTELNTMENKYEFIKTNLGYTIVAYNEHLGWLITHIHKKVSKDDKGKVINGKTELTSFENKCPDLINYRNNEEDGIKYKEKIRNFFDKDKPECFAKVCEDLAIGKTIENVCSLDIHSAYPHALTLYVPAMMPIIQSMYDQRKVKPFMKEKMLYPIGMMESKHTVEMYKIKVPYAYAKLKFKIMEYVSNRLHKVAQRLEEQGATILMFCTDSVKFIWPHDYPPYNIDIGDGLGQFHYEFYKTKFRMFGVKKYQYIDANGKHIVKLSGHALLENTKPRTEWDWDDLINTRAIMWKVDKETLKIQWFTTGDNFNE